MNIYNFILPFGALFIKQEFNITDEETILQIQEKAYLQYFIGFHEFTTAQPFTPSLMVSFRKRFPEEILNEFNEHLFLDGKSDDKDDNHDGQPNNSTPCDPSTVKQENKKTIKGHQLLMQHLHLLTRLSDTFRVAR